MEDMLAKELKSSTCNGFTQARAVVSTAGLWQTPIVHAFNPESQAESC